MRRLADRDFLTALVLFGISALFSTGVTADAKDWIFPQLANYVVLVAAVIMLARFVLAAVLKHTPDLVEGFRDNRAVIGDLVVFCTIVLVYVLLMDGIGFWLDSFLMLLTASIYLTRDKTRHNLILAVIVPLGVCILAYFIFLRVFYVPLPEATWWPGAF